MENHSNLHDIRQQVEEDVAWEELEEDVAWQMRESEERWHLPKPKAQKGRPSKMRGHLRRPENGKHDGMGRL